LSNEIFFRQMFGTTRLLSNIEILSMRLWIGAKYSLGPAVMTVQRCSEAGFAPNPGHRPMGAGSVSCAVCASAFMPFQCRRCARACPLKTGETHGYVRMLSPPAPDRFWVACPLGIFGLNCPVFPAQGCRFLCGCRFDLIRPLSAFVDPMLASNRACVVRRCSGSIRFKSAVRVLRFRPVVFAVHSFASAAVLCLSTSPMRARPVAIRSLTAAITASWLGSE
jgi:hypothetical protein